MRPAESGPRVIASFLTAPAPKGKRLLALARACGKGRSVPKLRPLLLLAVAALIVTPVLANAPRTALGIFESWGAFRDPAAARCYAVVTPDATVGRASVRGYASVGFWPRARVRQQVYVRLTRPRGASAELRLTLGARRFILTGKGVHGWASDARMDAAIVAAMRSNPSMVVESRSADGRVIADTYRLRGAATAIDAAALGCAGIR
jgi:hypothetical protein